MKEGRRERGDRKTAKTEFNVFISSRQPHDGGCLLPGRASSALPQLRKSAGKRANVGHDVVVVY